MGHELINIHLGTDDSPFVVRPWLDQSESTSIDEHKFAFCRPH